VRSSKRPRKRPSRRKNLDARNSLKRRPSLKRSKRKNSSDYRLKRKSAYVKLRNASGKSSKRKSV